MHVLAQVSSYTLFAPMIAALLFGQASAEGMRFFQPPVGGFLSQGASRDTKKLSQTHLPQLLNKKLMHEDHTIIARLILRRADRSKLTLVMRFNGVAGRPSSDGVAGRPCSDGASCNQAVA